MLVQVRVNLVIEILVVMLAIITIWTDSRQRKIYNKVLLPIFILAVITNTVLNGASGLGVSLLGCLIGFTFLWIPYTMGGMSAGDVKLLAVYGALFTSNMVLTAFIYGVLIGGLISIYKLIIRQKTLAYGVPLSLGALLTLAFPWELILR